MASQFTQWHAFKRGHVIKFGRLQNFVLQIKLNLSIEVKRKIFKIDILLLINFFNKKDKLLKSKNQIL